MNKYERMVGKHLSQARWNFRGNEFYVFYTEEILDGIYVELKYTCDLTGITVEITRRCASGVVEEIAHNTYRTTPECVRETAKILLDIERTARERLEPYREGKRLYDAAVNRPFTRNG